VRIVGQAERCVARRTVRPAVCEIIPSHRYRQNRYFALFRHKRENRNKRCARQIPRRLRNRQGLTASRREGDRHILLPGLRKMSQSPAILDPRASQCVTIAASCSVRSARSAKRMAYGRWHPRRSDRPPTYLRRYVIRRPGERSCDRTPRERREGACCRRRQRRCRRRQDDSGVRARHWGGRIRPLQDLILRRRASIAYVVSTCGRFLVMDFPKRQFAAGGGPESATRKPHRSPPAGSCLARESSSRRNRLSGTIPPVPSRRSGGSCR
jgi:hypothetical protein